MNNMLGDSWKRMKEMTTPMNGGVPNNALVRAVPKLLSERRNRTMLKAIAEKPKEHSR